jgi:hypothetical protein
MKTPPFEPIRFLDQPPQNDPGEVTHLIRQAIVMPEKPASVLKGRIRQTLRRRSATRRRAMRAFMVGGAIFISGGVVGAVVQPILRLRSQPAMEAVESVTPSSPRRPRTGRAGRSPNLAGPAEFAPEPTVEVAAPAPASEAINEAPGSLLAAPPPTPTVDRPAAVKVPAPVKTEAAPVRIPRTKEITEKSVTPKIDRSLQMAMREPPRPMPVAPTPTLLQPPAFNVPAAAPVESASPAPRHVSPAKAAAPVAQPPSEPPPPAGPPPSEQALVGRAISSLRVQRRPATALAALDEYEARFPKGSMLAEVARLRAEALLLLGQNRAALDELSRDPVAGSATDEESRLVRGELRASAGRWREAFQDFDALVAGWLARGPRAVTSSKLQGRFERALWGRACARSHLGDEAGARADLQDLLLRFPQGRFAAQASRRLGEPR